MGNISPSGARVRRITVGGGLFSSAKAVRLNDRVDIKATKCEFLQSNADPALLVAATHGRGIVKGVVRSIHQHGAGFTVGIETDKPVCIRAVDEQVCPQSAFEHEAGCGIRCAHTEFVKANVVVHKRKTGSKRSQDKTWPQYCAVTHGYQSAKFACDMCGAVRKASLMWRIAKCGHVYCRTHAQELDIDAPVACPLPCDKRGYSCKCEAEITAHELAAILGVPRGAHAGGAHGAAAPLPPAAVAHATPTAGGSAAAAAAARRPLYKQLQVQSGIAAGTKMNVTGWLAANGQNPFFLSPSNIPANTWVNVVWQPGCEYCTLQSVDLPAAPAREGAISPPQLVAPPAAPEALTAHSPIPRSDARVLAIQGFGFTYEQALDALKRVSTADRAIEWLLDHAGAQAGASDVASPLAPVPAPSGQPKHEGGLPCTAPTRLAGAVRADVRAKVILHTDDPEEKPQKTKLLLPANSDEDAVLALMWSKLGAAACIPARTLHRVVSGRLALLTDLSTLCDNDELVLAHHALAPPIEADGESIPANISPAACVSELAAANLHNAAVVAKARKLSDTFSYHRWRHVRGDGNCYYRSIAVGLLEHCAKPSGDGRKTLQHFLALAASVDYTAGDGAQFESSQADQDAHTKLLTQLARTEQDGGGWQGVRWDADFEPHGAELASKVSDQIAHCMINDGFTDQACVRALRRLTADFLLAHRHAPTSEGGLSYEALVVAQGGLSMEEFCDSVVLRMGIEAEGVILQALPLQLQISSRIIYLDRSEDTDLKVMDFGHGDDPKVVHLLLKPGHYDVLYLGGRHRPDWENIRSPPPREERGRPEASHFVQAPPDAVAGATVKYEFGGQLYESDIPQDVSPGEMFAVAIPVAAPPRQSEAEEHEELQRVLHLSQREALAREQRSRIGGGGSGKAAEPAADDHASWWHAEQRVHGYNAIAEEWLEGKIVAVLAGKIRVSFDLRDRPVEFEQVKDAHKMSRSFWEGEPGLLVGAQVQVRWQVDGAQQWFRGMITDYSPTDFDPMLNGKLAENRETLINLGKDLQGMHQVSYEDHTFGKHNMAAKTFKVVMSDQDYPHDTLNVVPFGARFPPQPRGD